MLLVGGTGNLHAADSILSQQVSFTSSDGTPLAGTLTVPSGITFKVPAVLLIQGSGPVDRDGNMPPVMRTDLMRQIADALAEQGIVSLRYDKRGMHANAASLPTSQEDYTRFFTWERFIDDAFAAYNFLRGQGMVDADKVGLLGHSEGGLIALDLASRLKGSEMPRALVLAATGGRKLDLIIRDQIERVLGEQKATPAQRRFFLAANDRVIKAITETGEVPHDVPPGLTPIYPTYIGPFLQAAFRLDPAALAQTFRGPVLVLQGDADRQISPEHDALALDRALKRRDNDDHALLMLPRTSHALKRLQNDEDPGFEGDVDPGLLNQLSGWVLKKLNR